MVLNMGPIGLVIYAFIFILVNWKCISMSRRKNENIYKYFLVQLLTGLTPFCLIMLNYSIIINDNGGQFSITILEKEWIQWICLLAVFIILPITINLILRNRFPMEKQ